MSDPPLKTDSGIEIVWLVMCVFATSVWVITIHRFVEGSGYRDFLDQSGASAGCHENVTATSLDVRILSIKKLYV